MKNIQNNFAHTHAFPFSPSKVPVCGKLMAKHGDRRGTCYSCKTVAVIGFTTNTQVSKPLYCLDKETKNAVYCKHNV